MYYRAMALRFEPTAGRCLWTRVCVPICVYTSSVKAPMNCGVAFRSSARRASSTNWPIEYQSADLRRCGGSVSLGATLSLTMSHLLSLGGLAVNGSHGAVLWLSRSSKQLERRDASWAANSGGERSA